MIATRPKLRRERRGKNDENMLPLINVVFLLLIFFMLTAQISTVDPFQVTPPSSSGGDAAEARETLVLLAADGRIALGDRIVDMDGLQQLIAARLEQQDSAQIKVKADARVEAALLMELMRTLQAAGVERLVLLTTPSRS